MNIRKSCLAIATAMAFAIISPAALASDQGPSESCELSFTLTGWPAGIRTAHGSGIVTCETQTMPVELDVQGDGLRIGAYKGEFSHMATIEDALGEYNQTEASGSPSRSSQTANMSNGKTSVTLSDTGKASNLKFTIKKAPSSDK